MLLLVAHVLHICNNVLDTGAAWKDLCTLHLLPDGRFHGRSKHDNHNVATQKLTKECHKWALSWCEQHLKHANKNIRAPRSDTHGLIITECEVVHPVLSSTRPKYLARIRVQGVLLGVWLDKSIVRKYTYCILTRHEMRTNLVHTQYFSLVF